MKDILSWSLYEYKATISVIYIWPKTRSKSMEQFDLRNLPTNLLQAYISYICINKKLRLQMGGSDQWGNYYRHRTDTKGMRRRSLRTHLSL